MLEKLLKKDPKDIDALFTLGNNYFDAKEYKRAGRLFQKLRKRHAEIPPGSEADFEVARNLVHCYYYLGPRKSAKAVEVATNYLEAAKILSGSDTLYDACASSEANLTMINILAELHTNQSTYTDYARAVELLDGVFEALGRRGQAIPPDLLGKSG